MASIKGPLTKLLNKALEDKHSGTVRKFDKAKSENEVQELWAQAKKEGHIEGAYWAVATHPAVSETFFNDVFGHIHMLSHLVGASNRADVKRLMLLESDVSILRANLEESRAAMRTGFSQRELEIQKLRRALATSIAAAPEPRADLPTELSALRNLVVQLQRQLAAEISRRENIQTERDDLKVKSKQSRDELQLLQERNRLLEDDLCTLEGHVGRLTQRESNADNFLDAKVILYVGGKSSTISNLRDSVERLGGSFLHHDGGKEQKISLLPGLISRADFVFFPVDFISHHAMHSIKQYCALSQIPFVALHRSGIAAFSRGLHEHVASQRN